MPSNRKNGRLKGRRKKPAPNASVLRQIADSERTQARSVEPKIRDVTRMISPKDKIYTIARTSIETPIVASTTVPVVNSIAYNLSALPNSSEFTALFDRFRIIQVTTTFIPTSLTQVSAPLYTVIDYDDANNLSSASDAIQYETCMISQGASLVERTLTPKIALNAYNGAFGAFAQGTSRTWVDVASPGTQYYGLKYYLPASGGANASWTVNTCYTIQFKNPR